ncbi:glutathione S-transferase [Rhodocollybia butyracea]|uniref:Glutathione S-transferase n=1 Tax=Rhodocollybia butyracea TaxID=206335 RepID=A0A9P5TW22_9AGAR|nr:glutathione S-transferase [Rhodocollybia butyracea]
MKKIFTHENNPLAGAHRALRILATAALANKTVTIDPSYTHRTTNVSPEFREKFPIGQAPAFETLDGEYISEGSAIALYIALKSPESGLLPSDPVGQALVAQWQGFIDFSVLGNLIFVYGSLGGHNGEVPPVYVQKKYAAAVDALAKLDVLFARKEAQNEPAFLIGDRVTLADIAVVSGLVRGYQSLYDKSIQEKYPHVMKYTKSILAIPEVKGVYGEVKFAEVSPLKLV